ncbi:hypothetical protein ES703_108900 [subsurface metagenome]
MRDRAHLEAQRGVAQHGEQDREHRQREDEDPEPVIGDGDLAELEGTAHPGGIADLAVGRTEGGAHRLLQHQRETPGGEQCLQRTAVEETDDAALDGDPDRAGDQKGERHRDQQRIVEQAGIGGADHLLHHEGGVGADHHHLAMRHVDDAHDTEGDGKTNGGEQQHRAERQAVPGVLHHRPHGEVALDRGDRARHRLGHQRRLVGAGAGEQRHGFLVAARLDHSDGVELVRLRGVGLEQQDGRTRLDEGGLGALVGLLRQRLVDGGERVLVMRLEDGLRGGNPLGGIRRHQGQAAERGIDGATQAVVEPDFGGAVRQLVDGRTSRGIDDLVVGLFDEDLLAVGIGEQPLFLQGADDGEGERIAGGGDRVDRVGGVGEIVVGEFGDRVLESAGIGRQRKGHDQQQCKSGRAKAVKERNGHWTSPAGDVEKAATAPPSPLSSVFCVCVSAREPLDQEP